MIFLVEKKRTLRDNMGTMPRIPTPGPRANPRDSLWAGILLAAWLWISVLAACPQLHEMIHADAGGAHHECAVTLVQSGGCDAPSLPPMVADSLPVATERVVAGEARAVAPLLVDRAVRGRAPPVA